MKIVFLGTPNFSVPILEMLIKHHEVLLVVTQPDKMVGRKKILTPSPVKVCALTHHIDVFQPVKLRKDYQKILDLNPDLLITAAYGQMLPKGLIEPITSINVHGSLLPKYRGGAPIQYAIFNGDQKTGISIMYMAYKMDSGDVIEQEEIVIEDSDNYASLTKKMSLVGASLLQKVLNDLSHNIVKRFPQDESKVTFAYNISYEDEAIHFHMTTKDLMNKVRGLDPEPGAHFNHLDTKIKVYKVQKSDIIIENKVPGEILQTKKHLIIKTLDGAVELLDIQVAGKKRMDVKSFLNGQSLFKIGEIIKDGELNG
jgi:methionyl-tRNA formyltransferase